MSSPSYDMSNLLLSEHHNETISWLEELARNLGRPLTIKEALILFRDVSGAEDEEALYTAVHEVAEDNEDLIYIEGETS